MGKRTTESTETRTIGALTPAQQQVQDLLARNAEQFSGQFGDLSQLAAGNLGSLSPEIERLIQESTQAERLAIQQNFENEIRTQGELASQKGRAGSSADSIMAALIGQGRTNQLAGLESRSSAQRINLPFQLAQSQLGANQLIGGLVSGSTNPLLAALSQERLGQGTSAGTQTQTGGAFETALGFGSSFASGGAFGAGGTFGRG